MEWFFLDLAVVNFVKWQLSLGDFMFLTVYLGNVR